MIASSLLNADKSTNRIHVTFVDKQGDEHKFEVSQGDNLLDIAQSEELEMEGIASPPAPHTPTLIISFQEHVEDRAPALLATL